jgi:hypothetical protein
MPNALNNEPTLKLLALRAKIEAGIASGIATGDIFAGVRRKAGLPPRERRFVITNDPTESSNK